MDYNTLKEKLLNTAAKEQWSQIEVRPHHGICLPLFSLHSQNSGGVGEFLDLIPMILWCKEIGLDVIQLLPLNDNGLGTSPYNALSAFALSPLNINLQTLPGIEEVEHFQEKLSKIQYWNNTPRVKYHIVRELKMSIFRDYFNLMFSEISQGEDYQRFLSENAWLESYALFKAIKEIHFWKSWEDWPPHLKSPSKSIYQELLKEYENACHFHTFLQYFCFQQFESVKKIASENGIKLKGDIPILISRDSADVWHNRHIFHLELAAGAPPDQFTSLGQYWGFPIYDWEELEKSGYSWWKERLKSAAHLYHLYRIDHVVGFFRMWSIPLDKPAIEGTFVPQQEHEWIPHGQKLMAMMLQSAPILPIGEDLGLVPTSVKQALQDLGICGTKVMRWEKNWDGDGSFIPTNEYPEISMTTVSTHDTDTLQLWWRHSPKEAKQYAESKGWHYVPFLSLENQEAILRDSHKSRSLFHINLFQEYLALFPELVSANPNNERINIPGKILDTNWTYRFKPSVEQIISHPALKQKLKDIISS